MPSMETACRHQLAIMWEKLGYDNYGEPELDDPVDLGVRFQETFDEVLDPLTANNNKGVWVVVDRDVPLQSLIYLGGRITDIAADTKIEVYMIINKKMTPDIKNKATRRTIKCMRYDKQMTVQQEYLDHLNVIYTDYKDDPYLVG